jgi:hypothetical protein
MTPKEKALELVEDMFNCPETGYNEHKIECALVAVDEILKLEQARLIVGSHNYYDYYLEVKQEIEKL